jgi:hypothetical protein
MDLFLLLWCSRDICVTYCTYCMIVHSTAYMFLALSAYAVCMLYVYIGKENHYDMTSPTHK